MFKSDNRYINSRVLARISNVPSSYVPKILRKLVNADLLDSLKGPQGGFKIKKEPSEITFKMILEAVGYSFCLDDCVFGWEDCDDGETCPLHNQWIELNYTFQQWAENKTLEGVLK